MNPGSIVQCRSREWVLLPSDQENLLFLRPLTGATDEVVAVHKGLTDIRELILDARKRIAQTVNAGLVLLYWQVGQRIRKDILKEKRADYGEEILHTLSAKLVSEFGRGFSERNLANMVRCAEAFPDPKILHALSAKLSWTHPPHRAAHSRWR